MSERPTARPPFDPAQFAEEAESKLRHAEARPSRRATPRALPRPPLLASRTSPEEGATAALETRALRQNPAPEAIPLLAMSRQELEWFALSPAAGRLIAQVDGVSRVDAVCLQAGVPDTEGALILLELCDQGIVTFR